MNAREVIIQELHYLGSFLPEDEADNIICTLRIAGFVILPRSEVEAIRNKALEEAARMANGWHPHNFTCKKIATAIRKLKSGGNNGE